MLKLTTEM